MIPPKSFGEKEKTKRIWDYVKEREIKTVDVNTVELGPKLSNFLPRANEKKDRKKYGLTNADCTPSFLFSGRWSNRRTETDSG